MLVVNSLFAIDAVVPMEAIGEDWVAVGVIFVRVIVVVARVDAVFIRVIS